jgi:hypothetical protein
MAGWLWWCYNENSHDTGGIVYDNWKQLDWNKLKFMINSLGLTPWYKDSFVASGEYVATSSLAAKPAQ